MLFVTKKKELLKLLSLPESAVPPSYRYLNSVFDYFSGYPALQLYCSSLALLRQGAVSCEKILQPHFTFNVQHHIDCKVSSQLGNDLQRMIFIGQSAYKTFKTVKPYSIGELHSEERIKSI